MRYNGGEKQTGRDGAINTEHAPNHPAAKDSDEMAEADPTTGKAPAFQFYPADFLSDRNVVVMSMQERGVYITLICHAWQGPLPTDPAHLARICGVPLNGFRKLWPNVAICFREQDGGLIHPRLERERQKQIEYRDGKSEAGKRGAAKRWQKDGTAMPVPLADGMANDSSYLVSSQTQPSLVSSQTPSGGAVTDARSKRPIFKGQRFVVFEWMLDDLSRLLGEHANDFDLHAWFYELDRRAVETGVMVPQRDGGKWLQERTQEEAIRRGIPLAVAAATNPKLAGNLAAAARFIARGAAR